MRVQTGREGFFWPLDSEEAIPQLTPEELAQFEAQRRELGFRMLAGVSVYGSGQIRDISVRGLVLFMRRDQIDMKGEAEAAGPYIVANGNGPHQYAGIALYVRNER